VARTSTALSFVDKINRWHQICSAHNYENRTEILMYEIFVQAWAHESLIRASAARRCAYHNHIVSNQDDRAVRQAVIVARLGNESQQSADSAELAILESFLALPDKCPRCLPQR
jgi:hypothetical protein